MHSKSIIHNDIKPDNILLDGDEEERLFPVITDFGIVKLLDTADVVEGFERIELKALTNYYSAPEVLVSIKQKGTPRVSNIQTDIYSVGVVFYELITRRKMWSKFDKKEVVNGCIPELNLQIIKDQWKDIKLDIALNLLSVLNSCLQYEPHFRLSLDIINEHFIELENRL